MTHGQVIGRVLYKRGSQVVKYWKFNGYAVPVVDLQKIDGVKLYTKYDGKLYASKETFNEHGIPHMFNNGKQMEHQIILPLEYWESI